MNGKIRFSLRTKIVFLVFSLVLLSSGVSGTLLIEKVFLAIEKEIGQRALSIARSVSQVDQIIDYVGIPGGWRVIEPVAERIRLATNVEYIVILDMDKVRYSSPVKERIGTLFQGGDESPAFAEHAYISRATGVNGPSVRAFVPIMKNSVQEGVVVVGIVTPTYMKLLWDYRSDLYLTLFIALSVGFVGSFLLAYNIKKQMFNMEPQEIARLLEERVAVFHSIGEGIIAIDRNYKITIANPEAYRILGLNKPIVGSIIHHVIPDSPLVPVIESGVPEYNQDRMIGSARVLISIIPIKFKETIVGAVATFRDKTDVYNLAEELTGVKQFIEALRVQNHEYMNKLHTIAGLIQLGKPDQALTYIFDITEQQQELAAFLTNNICDYAISGLLLGKVSRARELGIDLQIDRNSRLRSIPKPWDTSILVAILGNLLENAMESFQGQALEERHIFCSILDYDPSLQIIVEDNGSGIPKKVQDLIYIQGFSTKENKHKNRGIGLALIHQYVQNVGGTIDLESSPGKGTVFTINIPKHLKEEEEL
jgi:two-component system, CitB family, sensor histidine kinase DctS